MTVTIAALGAGSRRRPARARGAGHRAGESRAGALHAEALTGAGASIGTEGPRAFRVAHERHDRRRCGRGSPVGS